MTGKAKASTKLFIMGIYALVLTAIFGFFNSQEPVLKLGITGMSFMYHLGAIITGGGAMVSWGFALYEKLEGN